MSTKASSLVSQARRWAGHYGKFSNGKEGAALTVSLSLRAAWDDNNADNVADVFVQNGSMLIGDDQLDGRETIREYLAAAFRGVFEGTRVAEEPVDVRFISEDVAIVITTGGLLYPQEAELPEERAARAMLLVVRRDGEWKLFSHQTSPIKS